MPSSYHRELETALECAKKASEACLAVLSEITSQGTLTKGDKSPVTVADFSSQAVVCRILKERFPEDSIVAEEASDALREPGNAALLEKVTRTVRKITPEADADSICRWIDYGQRVMADRYWCLDPIDGTKGFLRGDQFVVALGLVVDGVVRLGVLACPNLFESLDRPDGQRGVFLYAVRGEGAFQAAPDGSSKRRIEVSTPDRKERMRFCESFESAHADHASHQKIADRLGIAEPPIRMDSQAKYAIVARGDAAIYLRRPSPKYPDYNEKAWDHAAGSIIIEEAGGRVTDIHGKPLDFKSDFQMKNNTGVVATNGAIHEDVIRALKDL